ncbi:MAG: sulfatase [Gammaproteobacteria bacterium]|nr:sulfatase [Gammaproteobacteria bacterium]
MNPAARFLLVSALFNVGASLAQERPNVLFIAVDDLNHWVGHLDGHPGTLTPNIDRLAGRGVTFSRAYAAAPLCNPSRVSLLTGVMPARSGVYGNHERLREQLPDAVTLPQYFRQNGYSVKGGGKIFHAGPGDEEAWDEFFLTDAKAKWLEGEAPKEKPKKGQQTGMWDPWGPSSSDVGTMLDAKIADRIIAELEVQHDKPFFLAYGTYRPHLPWNVPQRYFEMHPLESVVLPTVIENDLADIPPFGRRLAAEVLDISNDRNHAAEGGDHANVLRYNQWRPAVQGYLASITFADAQVGKVLDALAHSPHADNTIVVLWGDHGYHLGQKEHWRKHTLWEDGLRTTLVISAPGFGNVRSDRVVSLLDLYPTLIELAGLEPREGMDGQSIVPLLREPDLPWPRPVVSTYGYQNHSIRTERWRYIRYHDGAEELYDHDVDPNEWTNLAVAPVADKHREVIDQLARNLPEVNVPAPESD